jgi:hypothetical protein
MESSAQSLFWHELTELRAAYEYVRLYRDHLTRWDTRFAVGRSVTGLAALGGWITTNINPQIWAGVIAAVQEWEQDIAAGRIEESKIKKSWGRLMASRADAEKKALPRGLPVRDTLRKLAKMEADAYFRGLYPEGS